MSFDADMNNSDSLGLSDDSDGDPTYVPGSQESKGSESDMDSPKLARSQRAAAREAEKDGKEKSICDATKLLMKQQSDRGRKFIESPLRQKSSFVWKYFTKVISEEGNELKDLVFCKLCEYKLRYTSSTSSMSYHIRTKHRDVFFQAKEVPAPGHTIKQTIKGKSTMKTYTHTRRTVDQNSCLYNDFGRLLARFVITSNSALSIIENQQLKEFLDSVSEPKYSMPSTNYLKNNIMLPMLNETEKNMKTELVKVQAIGLTSDGWQSEPGDCYESLTVHWVDESESVLKKCVLGIIPINERHTSENIYELIEGTNGILAKWDLLDKPRTYVTDNASNVVKAFSDDSWLGCFAHTLNLIVGAGISVKAISNVISIAKNAVSFIHNSSVARDSLKDYCERLGQKVLKVVTSCPTRWNSVLDMIERLCTIENAVTLTLNENKRQDLVPSVHNWKLMSEMVDALTLFKTTTVLISGEKYPTICYVKPLIQKLKTHLTKRTHDESKCIRDMKDDMLKNLNSRYTDVKVQEMLNIAAILDPFNKNVQGDPSTTNLLIRKTVTIAQSKAEGVQIIHCTEGQEYELLSSFNNASTSKTPPKDIKTSSQLIKSLYNVNNINPSEEQESLEDEIEYEVKSYMKFKIKGNENRETDILKWWKDHKDTFPNLYTLAIQYLCIPASSTSSERAFSVANNIVTKRRNRLLPENVQMLTFLKNNFEYVPVPRNTKGSSNLTDNK